MKVNSIRQIVQWVVNLVCVLVLVLPFSETYNPDIDGWENQWIYSERIVVLSFLMFNLFWILFQWIKHPVVVKIIGVIAVLASCWIFFIGMLTAGFPMQEYGPHVGSFLLFLLLPLTCLYAILHRFERRKKFVDSDVLDDGV